MLLWVQICGVQPALPFVPILPDNAKVQLQTGEFALLED